MRAAFAVLAGLSTSCASASAQPKPPDGSYASRCEEVALRGSVLRALCRDPSGAPRETSIDVLACRGRDIGVSETGALTCPGGGRPTIIVYAGTVWRGEWRAISADVADLARLGMNDRVRSIELGPESGRWEMCSNIRFGGRCVVLTTSVPDTGAFGLANDVSSVRRLSRPAE